MKIDNREEATGFTLVETLIAITIVTLSIAGPLYGAQRAIVAAYTARDQLIASYLAQEAIEYIRWMRDDSYLSAYESGDQNASADAWATFTGGYFCNNPGPTSICNCRSTYLFPYQNTPIVCTLDPSQSMGSALTVCTAPGTSCPVLNISNGIYTESQPSGYKPTVFTRGFTVTDIQRFGSTIEEDVKVTVSWQTNRSPFSITITDHLTPWQ